MLNIFDRAQYPKREPVSSGVRDRIVWRRDDLAAVYSIADFTLSYTFVSQLNTSEILEFAAIVADGSFVVEINPDNSAAFSSGAWSWEAIITRTSDGKTATVSRGVTQFSDTETASHAQKVLAALEATLEGKATDDNLRIEIGGRTLEKMSPGELLKWRDQYKAEISRQIQADRVASGLGSGRKIKARIR